MRSSDPTSVSAAYDGICINRELVHGGMDHGDGDGVDDDDDDDDDDAVSGVAAGRRPLNNNPMPSVDVMGLSRECDVP